MNMQRVWTIVCHGSIVLSVVFLVLFVIDRINPAMGFLGSEQGDWLLLAFCLSALWNGVLTAEDHFRREKRARRRSMNAMHESER